MLANERILDPHEQLKSSIEAEIFNMWTAIPAIIDTVDYVKQTLTAQPAVMAQSQDEKQNVTNMQLPLLVDVPFQIMGGSNFCFTMPNLEGSECLIVFSSRCIDGWWQSGGIQPQAELRNHDLSDGMAIIGFRSQPHVVQNYNTTAPELRTIDGSTKITLNNGNVTITGNLIVNGTIHSTGDTTAGSISLENHKHSDPQGGLTGVPQ
jgi:Phage protein Gp138 N-terminal domain